MWKRMFVELLLGGIGLVNTMHVQIRFGCLPKSKPLSEALPFLAADMYKDAFSSTNATLVSDREARAGTAGTLNARLSAGFKAALSTWARATGVPWRIPADG